MACVMCLERLAWVCHRRIRADAGHFVQACFVPLVPFSRLHIVAEVVFSDFSVPPHSGRFTGDLLSTNASYPHVRG